MKGTFALILAAAHVSVQPAAIDAYTLTADRLWATTVAVLALVGVVIGGLALARSAGRIGTGNGRMGAHRGPGGGADRRGQRRAGFGHRRRWSRHRQRSSRGHRGPGAGGDRHGPRSAGSDPLPPLRLTG
jgi:hypothetical protein